MTRFIPVKAVPLAVVNRGKVTTSKSLLPYLAAILTGMGTDGASGLLKLRRTGTKTIAQDEASCVVYGMPKEAVRLGAAGEILPLEKIPLQLLRWLTEEKAAS